MLCLIAVDAGFLFSGAILFVHVVPVFGEQGWLYMVKPTLGVALAIMAFQHVREWIKTYNVVCPPLKPIVKPRDI